MRKVLAILSGKIIIKFMKLLGFKSTVYPGYIAKKIYPNLLNDIKYPNTTIMVTGSSGKGSTTSMIVKVLSDNNYKVTSNKGGSNLLNAFTTTIINDSKLNGEVNSDILVFEIDERFLKEITKYIKPNYLVVNNITRDQPPRQGSFDEVFEEIVKGIYKDTHLIVNGDDPITRKFSLYHKGPITYFGINKNFMSFNKDILDVKDYKYCPKCNSKLDFDYYHYGSVGKFKCTNCDFKRDNISYEVTNINKDDMTITINKKYNIEIDNYILFNIYNLCATFSVCDMLKINKENIIDSLSNIKINKKIFNEFEIDNRKYTVLNCKAENNATYNLSLIYTMLDNNKKTIVLGLREISRRYKKFDLSWLYDISFELLNDESIDKIICAGPYSYDIAVRMKYAGINENKLIILEDLSNIKNELKNTNGDIYGILNFDYVEPFIKGVKE